MSQVSFSVSRAAAILVGRRRSGEQGPRLPEDCRPSDSDSAWAIQVAVSTEVGQQTGAWKCSLPVEARIIAAPIYSETIHNVSPCSAIARSGEVRIEPELAFILGQDLPAREQPYTPDEVDAAIASTHLALELIDSRYSDPDAVSAEEHLADGLLNQGLFIGPQVANDLARASHTMEIHVALDKGREVVLEGRHPSADPRAPLHWLAEFLRSKGQGLQAGQVVITGSYVPSFTVPVGQRIAIRYGSLGKLEVQFK